MSWILPVAAGLSSLGGIFGGSSKSVPPPKPIFPGAQGQYLDYLQGSPFTGQGVGPSSMTGLQSLIQGGGMPTNYIPNVQAITQSMQQGYQQSQANLMEKFGSMGLRFSSPAITGLGQMLNQQQLQNQSLMSQFAFNTQESAANRLMQALGMGTGLFSGPAMSMYQSQTLPGPGVASGLFSGGGNVLQTLALMRMLGGQGGGGSYTGGI